MKRKYKTAATSALLFTLLSTPAFAVENNTNTSVKPAQTGVTNTAATGVYYNYNGLVHSKVLVADYFKDSLKLNTFTYNNVKPGDTLASVKANMKKNGTVLKRNSSSVYTSDKHVFIFKKGKLTNLALLFNDGKTSRDEVEKVHGKPTRFEKTDQSYVAVYKVNKTQYYTISYTLKNNVFYATQLELVKR